MNDTRVVSLFYNIRPWTKRGARKVRAARHCYITTTTHAIRILCALFERFNV